jgi:endonuclease/exonuclease/phosphatase family metal-dependent hydrolase
VKAVAITILVLNMHAGWDAEKQANLGRVAAFVRESRADVVLLQEVDRQTRRSHGVDQPAVLARLTGMTAVFGRTLDYDGGEYGIAVLARGSIVNEGVVPLRVDPPQPRAGGSTEPRGVLSTRIRLPSGVELRVLNTHLDASKSEEYRLQEVDRLIATARGLPNGTPVVIGGDFNATPDSETYARMGRAGFIDAWAACGSGKGLTYPAGKAAKRIDYLFLQSNLSCERANVPAFTASDHQPLIVRVLRPPA